jgi:demethylmenaquinone methyltransferase/2-methoxy-6-polyprenyl-1,4-benzoquinol methylase
MTAASSAIRGRDLAHRFFPGTGASYDRVVRTTSLGLDRLWKRAVLAKIPREARSFLDLACGTGILTFELLRRFPGARVVGVDLTEDYLAVARAKHARRGGAVTFLHGNAETTPVAGPFDAIVSCYVPKYVDADRMLANVAPALRPGGTIVLQDFTVPKTAFHRLCWELYMALLDPVARVLFREWDKVFDTSLTRLIRTSRWVGEFRDALPHHGFEDLRVDERTFRACTIVSARKVPSGTGGATG